MKISGIDFPKSLLDALRDGELVVFAGAGVSMGEPASLPSFKELSIAIAQGTGETLLDREQEDRFLGRLHFKGVDVHQRAAQELSRDEPRPTDLHRYLLRLYSTPQAVRIVTTNLDLLFEDASEDVFESQPEVFNAPALPLGTKFNGIVHVHGSIELPSEMVLTDSDFGRAYLTEGWARRFLVDLFRCFTVLFVGYSHNDSVMNYLSRALPPGGTRPRFVLTDETDINRWQILGVEPIIYRNLSGGAHNDLYVGVDSLAKFARRGILDWQREIREIAKVPPSLDQEGMDLIEDALSDSTHTRFFTEAAVHTEWIDWLDKRTHLDNLFGAGASGDLLDRDRLLAWWLAKQFAFGNSDQLFLLFARHKMYLHPDFWTALGLTIGLNQKEELDASNLDRWVSLLLATAPKRRDNRVLPLLGERCAQAGLANSLLDVFDAMAVGHLTLTRHLYSEVEPVYDHFRLDGLWKKCLKPMLDQIAEPLLTCVTRHIQKRHNTLGAWQSVDRDWYRRSAIEPHEQDRHPAAIDVLIDSARDCLAYLAAIQPDTAANWCDFLAKTDVPILRRLAVYALSVREDLSANEKAMWIMANIGLNDFVTHHETFQAMRNIYPKSSQEQRKAILDDVLAQDLLSQQGDRDKLIAADAQLNWLHWLQESDPNCHLVKQPLEDLKGRYPDLKRREHPDMTYYATGVHLGTPQSPWSVEELLSRPACEWTNDLLSYDDRSLFDQVHDGILRAIEEASTQNFEWGLDLADALAESSHWDAGLWLSLTSAWSRELNEDNHRMVLARLSKTELYAEFAQPVAAALYAIVKGGGLPYATNLLAEANDIALALWDSLDVGMSPLEDHDWLTRAINHPAGILTQYWLASLGLWLKQQDPRPESLDGEYSAALFKIMQDKTRVGTFGKAILANELGFILAADEHWTMQHLIPLFGDVEHDDCRAVWDGFLYGSLNPQVASALEGAFLKAVSCMGKLFPDQLGDSRHQFTTFYALMVAYFIDEPFNLWIPSFFANAEVEDRRRFAWAIGSALGDIKDGGKLEWWERWLKKYWENRLQGIPTPLNAVEIESMLEWLPNFGELFPEAVEFATRTPNTPLERDLVIWGISESDLPSRYPEATARLLVHLGNSESPPWMWHDGKGLIETLLQLNLPEDHKAKLKELLVKI